MAMSTPAVVPNAAPSAGGLLVDVFETSAATTIISGSSPAVTPGAEEMLKKYVKYYGM